MKKLKRKLPNTVHLTVEGIPTTYERFTRTGHESLVVRTTYGRDEIVSSFAGTYLPRTAKEAEKQAYYWEYSFPLNFFLHWTPVKWRNL